jgi:hypothetical protein
MTGSADKVEFVSIVKQGRFAPEVQQAIREVMRRMEGQKLRVQISKYRKKRSDRQNRYYWSCVVERVWDALVEAGNDMTKEETHDFLKNECKLVIEVMDPHGEIIQTLKSTTKLTTLEFENYMTKCRVWAAERGIDIPEPNEYGG